MNDVNDNDLTKKYKGSKHHVQPWQENAQKHIIKKRLVELGANAYDIRLPETNAMPRIIHPEEKINGIVYGKYKQESMEGTVLGRGVLVATNKRVVLIDRKPLFTKNNELSYSVTSGVSYSKVGFATYITLHTRLGNINVRTFNSKCAKKFVEAIEDTVFRSDKSKLDP